MFVLNLEHNDEGGFKFLLNFSETEDRIQLEFTRRMQKLSVYKHCNVQ
jgi:hypothetical protein